SASWRRASSASGISTATTRKRSWPSCGSCSRARGRRRGRRRCSGGWRGRSAGRPAALRVEAARADNAPDMSELRVPTVALAAEVTCVDGRTFTGRVFVPAAASHHSGPMRPEEWINEPLPYFPFLPDDAAVPVMLNKHTVIAVTLPRAEGPEAEVPIGVERRV